MKFVISPLSPYVIKNVIITIMITMSFYVIIPISPLWVNEIFNNKDH